MDETDYIETIAECAHLGSTLLPVIRDAHKSGMASIELNFKDSPTDEDIIVIRLTATAVDKKQNIQ